MPVKQSTILFGIREEDDVTLITVGLLPLGPINLMAEHLDIISTHIYPDAADLQQSIDYIIQNQSDKPFVLEEYSSLYCDTTDLKFVLSEIKGYHHGMIGHYFGKRLEEHDQFDITDALHKNFLEFFINNNPN